MNPELSSGDLLLSATLLSLKVALISTALILPPGVLLGWLLARRKFWGRSLLQTLIALPMVLPPVAVGLGLLLLLSPDGPIGRALAALGLHLVFTWWAAVLAAMVVSLPLLVRASEAAIAEVPLRLEQVSRSLGASRLQTFWRVTLPLARRGVLYGALLAFARALGEFGATVMVAGNIPGETMTLSLGIYNRFENGHDEAAITFVGVSLVLAFVPMLIAERWLRRRS